MASAEIQLFQLLISGGDDCVGVTRPGRLPSVARLAMAVNPGFGGKTGRNPPPSAARGAVRRGGLLASFPMLFDVTESPVTRNLRDRHQP